MADSTHQLGREKHVAILKTLTVLSEYRERSKNKIIVNTLS